MSLSLSKEEIEKLMYIQPLTVCINKNLLLAKIYM